MQIQKMLQLFVPVVGLLAIISCAHHRDVRPGSDGTHRVVVRTEDNEEGERNAISQANHYCEGLKKHATFIDEKKQYTGSMKEEDYKKLKTASTVAKTVGGAAYVFGGKNESSLGGLVGLGGIAADAAAGKGYTVEMKFNCN